MTNPTSRSPTGNTTPTLAMANAPCECGHPFYQHSAGTGPCFHRAIEYEPYSSVAVKSCAAQCKAFRARPTGEDHA